MRSEVTAVCELIMAVMAERSQKAVDFRAEFIYSSQRGSGKLNKKGETMFEVEGCPE